MNHFLSRTAQLAVTVILAFQLSACGTILHSERKGQTGGRLDPAIVLLDGIGLLAFLIPGIIAFAVDFSNGTIYLPNSASNASDQKFRTVKFDASNVTYAQIEQIVEQEMAMDIDLQSSQVDVIELENIDELSSVLSQINHKQLASTALYY